MDDRLKQMLPCVDHTLLSVTATEYDFRVLCDEAVEYNVASVCVPPTRVEFCANYLDGRVPVCTVVGFPNGYMLGHVKMYETARAINQGAKEIDMVANISLIKEGAYSGVLAEIEMVKKTAEMCILKVIIETCLLTDEEKIKMCKVVGESGADYIKTSTGFAGGGATFDDVKLLREHSPAHVKVKAAGGISSFEDAYKFIEFGAARLGTSKIVRLVQGMIANCTLY